MQQDPEGSIFRLLPTMVSFYPEKFPEPDELDSYTDGIGLPFYPIGSSRQTPVCMIWDLVAQNGPMTGMRQIITLILR